jgi:hypothetical protein
MSMAIEDNSMGRVETTHVRAGLKGNNTAQEFALGRKEL